MSPRRSVSIASLVAVAVVLTTVCTPLLAGTAGSTATATDATASTATASTNGDPTGETNRSADAAATGDGPRIVGLYPNPVTDGDAGEYVVLDAPTSINLSGWTLGDDGGDNARLPNETVEGTIAASVDPESAENGTGNRVLPLSGRLRLANGGDRVALRRNGTLVDAVAYGRAPEGELWRRDRGGADNRAEGDSSGEGDEAEARGNWTPLGATDHEPSESTPDAVTAFALPDAPELPVERIERADDRVLLAGYTFADERVAEALVDARARGVRVEVAIEGSPVGGVTARQARLLDDLVAAGIDVVAFGGERARYRFHHPKYAVIDDEALVMTENWKPSGTGGRSSRGWGVVVHGADTAESLREVFDADVEWRDAVPWAEYRNRVDAVEEPPANGSYPRRIEPKRLDADSVRLLTAPDNAESELRELLEGADESIMVTQVSIGGRDNPLLRSTLDAARDGASVKILLSSAWYVESENRKLANWLERRAAAEDLDLRVRLADPRGRYEKIHAKGVVVDEEAVVVGSANWNNNSLRENREVAVVIEGSEPGEYYARLFRADWRGGVERFPLGLGAALVVGAVAAAAVARRRVEFE